MDDNIIGWFIISFKVDIDHEYPFIISKDGKILPDIDKEKLKPNSDIIFYQFLSDPDFHKLRFIQRSA